MTAVEYRRLEPVTVYAASGVVPGGEDVPATIDRILPALEAALEKAGVEHHEPAVFWYEPVDGTDDLRAWVSWIAGDAPVSGDDWEVVRLPAVERAAVTLHHGEVSGIGSAWQRFMQDITADGATFDGACREVYLQAEGPQSEWVTELQQPVV